MDGKTFPNGPGLYYSNPYFLGGDTYKGPYTDPDAEQQASRSTATTITIKMSKPFPDIPYYASFPAMGPIPTDQAVSDPATYAQHPLATGPYKIEQYTIGKSLTLVRTTSGTRPPTRLARQYPDGYDVQGRRRSPTQIDQILLADSGDGKTTIDLRRRARPGLPEDQTTPDRLVAGRLAVHLLLRADYRKITDKSSRARRSPGRTRTTTLIVGQRPDPGRHRDPGDRTSMPPGIPGREEYNPVEGHGPFQTDPAKAKQILADSGNEGYEIKFLFSTTPTSRSAGKDVLRQGPRGGRLQGHPGRHDAARLRRRTATTLNGDINVRVLRLVLGLAVGRDLDPADLRVDRPRGGRLRHQQSAFNDPEIDDEDRRRSSTTARRGAAGGLERPRARRS